MTRLLASLALATAMLGCSGSEGERPLAPSEEDRPVSRPTSPTAEPARAQATVWLEPVGRPPVPVRVEVAITSAQTQRGLMFRRQMDADAGMLFLFAEQRQMTFWMRNTYLPLDMIFITNDHRVLGVLENATPETDSPREVEGESQFVLEVNAGFAREHDISAGTVVRFEDVPPPPGASLDDENLEQE